MCGIAGFFDENLPFEENHQSLVNMLRAIDHRGPDGTGTYIDGGLYLGHNRLSIIDLSERGKQPMKSNSGRYICSYNGEIYNYKELKLELEEEGFTFISETDTEVLLTLIDHLGFEQSLKKCVGMFAIALWDKKEKVLRLARDRHGEKPLYYGWHKGKFLFGSELKSLIEHPAFEKEICQIALSSYFKFNYIEAPLCIFKGTKKLGAGEILSLDTRAGLKENTEKITNYWSLKKAFIHGIENPYSGNYSEAKDVLEAHLNTAIKQQMHADVPMGAMLSGGIDSSLVVALMQNNSSNKINTFSIGFSDEKLDEAKYAKEIASYLGTNHQELYVSELEIKDASLQMSSIFDEPFCDSSQVPTFLLSKLARDNVTVSLSGDGGDELFFGYSKYSRGHKISQLPCKYLLFQITQILSNFPDLSFQRLVRAKQSLAFLSLLINHSDFKNLHELLSSDRFSDKYLTKDFEEIKDDILPYQILDSFSNTFMYQDSKKYLIDDILVKVDRASMAVSLENRVPFLDHRIIEFSSTLPFEFLYSQGEQKRILRDIAFEKLPKNLLDRPKSGFVPPISQWLKNDLKDWAIDLLNDHESVGGFIDLEYGRQLFDNHIKEKGDYSIQLWKILMFIDWYRRWA